MPPTAQALKVRISRNQVPHYGRLAGFAAKVLTRYSSEKMSAGHDEDGQFNAKPWRASDDCSVLLAMAYRSWSEARIRLQVQDFLLLKGTSEYPTPYPRKLENDK